MRPAASFLCASSLLLAVFLLPWGMAQAKQNGGSQGTAKLRPAAAGSAPGETEDGPSPFRITGRVISSLSQTPVARAVITVSPMGARRSRGRFAGRTAGQTAMAVADAEGRFSVEVPSAGGWSLSTSAHGYSSQAFEEHGEYSTAIMLTEALPVHEVTIRLTPAAAIEGYVLDDAGEAVRNAQLTVSVIPPASPEDSHPRRQGRGSQRTDDRGYYKFSGLLAGSYDVRVQAQPWYATSGEGGHSFESERAGGTVSKVVDNIGAGRSASDPLDVVYPVVWFPGVTDFAAASPITLRGGETKEADFRLLPVPGFHLRVGGGGPSLSIDGDGKVSVGSGLGNNTYLTQLLPEGTEAPVPAETRLDTNGTMEFSGLAPGTYVVHRQGDADPASTATIRISGNSARTLDVSQAVPSVPVVLKIDAKADRPSLQISFRDVETGHLVQGEAEFGMGRSRRGAPVADAGETHAKDEDVVVRTINLQPGRYEVVLNGIGDMHLTGIEAKGATATGRMVTITGGAPTLTLHVADGRANVTGFVRSHGKPVQGALVLLVPATLGDPTGLDVTRRDQSNTDGSFDMAGVLPGAYILVAIDHGWDLNWSDPATLRGFLMHGLPLDLGRAGDRKETVEAQSP